MLTGPALGNLAAAISRPAGRDWIPCAAQRGLAATAEGRAGRCPVVGGRKPATLLFTQSYREELPEEYGPSFVENEFLRDDVNKSTELAATRPG